MGTATFNAPKTLDDYSFHATYEAYGDLYNAKHTLSDKDKGDLTKVVHNRKYMEENPNIDTSKLKDEDLHDWKLVGKVVEPTLEKDGYADYICSIDKCGQTKHVVLPKLTPEPSEPDTPSTPETPDTPDTPNKPDVPSTPEVTPADPAVTPDAPAQDGTAPADTPAADTTAAAQNVAQNAEPEAAAAAPAALPQTGANWLAVAGSALSGLFLLAAGFVLDRKAPHELRNHFYKSHLLLPCGSASSTAGSPNKGGCCTACSSPFLLSLYSSSVSSGWRRLPAEPFWYAAGSADLPRSCAGPSADTAPYSPDCPRQGRRWSPARCRPLPPP